MRAPLWANFQVCFGAFERGEMATVSELACVYASLILQDERIDLSASNISKLVKAAEVTVEPISPTLFAKNVTSISIESLITNIGSGIT